MPIPKKIIKFLEGNKVKYETIKHRTVYTAYDKAQTLKVSEKIVGKTLVLKTDQNLAIVLIPANKNLDKKKFLKVANAWLKKRGEKTSRNVDFISERLMKNKFKGMKIGAIPPFGNLFGLPTFIDGAMFNQSKIIVNSGNYNFSIKILTSSFKKITPDLIKGSFTKIKK